MYINEHCIYNVHEHTIHIHVYAMYVVCIYMSILRTYMYMMYLGSDEVTNHEGKSQHQHFHVITSHLCMFLAINVNVVEMGHILRGQGDH